MYWFYMTIFVYNLIYTKDGDNMEKVLIRKYHAFED